MYKRRKLSPGQQVVIIYDTRFGFVEHQGTFTQYRRIMIGDAEHDIPVFDQNGEELTGLDCFWILPEDAVSPEHLQNIQFGLIAVQLKALEIGIAKQYTVPIKIKDKEIRLMAAENNDRINHLIQKFGFDPRDETWIERDLPINDRERNWFRFERENALVFTNSWDDIIAVFNHQFKDNLTLDEAKNISKKRMRYMLGAYNTRMSGNPKYEDWKQSAIDFEKKHRDRENRMLSWTHAHKESFPLVRTIKPVRFWPGPHFNKCIERIPHVFTTPNCNEIKDGIVLRVISYDSQDKYIRLDFTPEVRKEIKGIEQPEHKIWIKDQADYDIWIKPAEIATHLELLESLD